jgi:hypothetical protein
MEIELTSRVQEAKKHAQEFLEEIRDYEMIVMLIKALAVVELDPEKYTYSKTEFDKCVSKLYNLCEKHEIRLPSDPATVEWESINIL